MAYVLGIDGGGTKTECLVESLSQSDQPSFRVKAKGSNPHVVGFDQMKQTLSELIQTVMSQHGIKPIQIKAMCIGLAGVDRPQDEKRVWHMMKDIQQELKLATECQLHISNDAYIALQGALQPEQKKGILVVAGTGSIAYGVDDDGVHYRSGGWGHILGDEGSGYDIGLKALQAVYRAKDGRGSQTSLTEAILQERKVSSLERLLPLIYESSADKSNIAQLSRVVGQCAEQGDEVARSILCNAAQELTLLIESMTLRSKQFAADTPITYGGSVLGNVSLIQNHVMEQIQEKQLGQFQHPYNDATYGAVKIAKQSVLV